MKRLIFFCIFILLPASLLASEFEYIFKDAEKFIEELMWQEEEKENAWNDSEFQITDLLFLDIDIDEDNQTQSGGIVSSTQYVTVTIGGRDLLLKDVPLDVWFAPYVRSAAEQGIVSGYKDEQGVLLGLFGPNDTVSIEQLAKMALEASGVKLSNCSGKTINNTALESWSKQYISCTEDNGWAIFSDGGIDVMRPATRSEVIVTILQAFSISLVRGTGELFDDVTVSTQFSGAIERAANDGIISGYADVDGNLIGTFGPSDPVTRAEVAKIVTLAKDVYGM